ncbi:hypothetical protein ACPOL_6263 [Acidisarcina polymorpha]|uniref:Uncharacterized protein n=1 Tax=Acidisarcina polymorpha TaxID=2211140 RepID=A0A2Z5G9X3_9BACT|nr:carboxypeptidase-like regulatory domain-containing protein [Acidisarcina polymorpha]AXC15504.1 hypothetical protein ACPOL_6263 [Acidisarcina polymorpha]
MSTPTHISGRLVDQAGAPLKTSKVELRSYLSGTQQTPVKIVTTDTDGEFDLGKLGPGKYRLLPSSTRALEQPQHFSCPKEERKLAVDSEPTLPIFLYQVVRFADWNSSAPGGRMIDLYCSARATPPESDAFERRVPTIGSGTIILDIAPSSCARTDHVSCRYHPFPNITAAANHYIGERSE